jgi:hypothetical protein
MATITVSGRGRRYEAALFGFQPSVEFPKGTVYIGRFRVRGHLLAT